MFSGGSKGNTEKKRLRNHLRVESPSCKNHSIMFQYKSIDHFRYELNEFIKMGILALHPRKKYCQNNHNLKKKRKHLVVTLIVFQ